MTRPFEIEVDCGSANPVRFTLDDARIRSAGVKVQLTIRDDTGDPDERTRLWRGAVQIAKNVIERNAGGSIEIWDGADVWIIPESSVRWVRVHDPEASRSRVEIGFRMTGEE